MKTTAYTYSVIKYLHDPVAGETLNIGVIMCAPEVGFIQAKLESHYERSSETFRNFDGEHYRQILRRFTAGINALRERLTARTLFDLIENPMSTAKEWGEIIWPDTGLSFQFSSVLAGVTENPTATLDSIFYRMVTSQDPVRTSETRTDDDVWALYQPVLAQKKITRYLRSTTIRTSKVEVRFEHAFRNEKWHLLQPLSMDYVRKELIQHKAARWLGNGIGLEESPEISRLYLLLGPPQLESHKPAYERAKNLLHSIPISHEFIEEDAAKDFASEIYSYIRAHGIESD